MQAEHRRILEKRYGARQWHGRSEHDKHVAKNFSFDTLKIPGWTLHRKFRDQTTKPPVIRTLWRHDESTDELLDVDLWECQSVETARSEVIEVLGNTQSNAVERRSDKDAVGDVTFALNNTMVLFARANLVVLVRNAGRRVVSVTGISRQIDSWILHQLDSVDSKRPAKTGKKR